MKKIIVCLIGWLVGTPSAKIIHLVRLMNIFRGKGFCKIAKCISHILSSKGVYISPHSLIDESINFPHPIAIVVGEGVVIGKNVSIYQNVTLGGARIGDWQAGNYPTIGENTVIFAGAVVVGKLRIGKNCIIGANSVVLTDIPDNSVCVGAPAKVVSTNRNKES